MQPEDDCHICHHEEGTLAYHMNYPSPYLEVANFELGQYLARDTHDHNRPSVAFALYPFHSLAKIEPSLFPESLKEACCLADGRKALHICRRRDELRGIRQAKANGVEARIDRLLVVAIEVDMYQDHGAHLVGSMCRAQ